MRRALPLLALPLLAACSFTVGQQKNFQECTVDQDCPGTLACVEHYCVGTRVPDGCGRLVGETPTDKTFHLGAVMPLSLPDGDGGYTDDPKENARLNAIQLALEEINQRDISGHPVVLHVCDSHGSTDAARAQASWLVTDTESAAVLTAGSAQTLAVAAVATPASRVTLSYSATSPEITALNATQAGSARLVWRTAPSASFQGKVMANLVKTDGRYAQVKKVGVLYLNDPYGQGLKDEFINALDGSGLETRSFQYDRGADVTQAMQSLNAFDPDLTINIAFPDDAIKMIKQVPALSNLKTANGHQWLFSDSAKSSSLLTGLSDAERTEIEGSLGAAPAQGAGKAYAAFKDAYASRYKNQDPSQHSFTAHAYDAVYVLCLAMASATRDGTGLVTGGSIASGLTRLSKGTVFELQASKFTPAVQQLAAGNTIDVDGASGSLNFDPLTGEAPGQTEIWKIAGTSLATDRVVDP